MRKILSFIAAFLILGGIVFADVSVKEVGDGKVEVTFFFGSTKANQVVIAGDWTDWQNGAIPMTKVENGWEYKIVVPANTVMKYKFIADGTWIFDIKAPDKIDDGFGGFNGLVDVAELLAAKKGGTKTAAAAPASGGSKLRFQTWSMVGTQAKFDTTNNMEVQSAGVGVKSYLKISGNALPSMPIYAEIALAENDGFENLYKKGSLAFSDGLTNLLVDTIFDPIYYIDGQRKAATYLGHLKLGFDSDYVNFVTGYKYAKLPGHTNVSWITVDSEWEAGWNETGGFAVFSLGPALRKIGDWTVNVTIGPNKTADRAGNQYGLFSYATLQNANHYFDFQYNGAFGTTYKTIFDEIYEADFIGGYAGKFDPVTIKANALYNLWGANVINDSYITAYNPSTSDVSGAKQGLGFLPNFAANTQVAYAGDYFGTTLGYRLRGFQANMMYVEQGADGHTHLVDQLGALNSQRVWLDVFAYPLDTLSVGLYGYVDLVLDKTAAKLPYNDKDNIQLYAKPSFELKLDHVFDIKTTLNGYVKLTYNTATADQFTRGTNTSQFLFGEGGLKLSMADVSKTVKGIDLYYGFDNNNANYLFNTLIGAVKLPSDLTLQGGAGLRTPNAGVAASSSPFGFFVGVAQKFKALQKPTAYAQFVYNMDPYNDFGSGPSSFNLNDFVTYNGVNNHVGTAAVRIGLHWDL
ncbi:MAG: glycogen-binding domain-containing protein [Spirochaetota bacterium]|jgi:hypothetical protein